MEYEQQGEDKAEYGEQLHKKLAVRIKKRRNQRLVIYFLHLCKRFYLTYPQIVQSVTEQFQKTIQTER